MAPAARLAAGVAFGGKKIIQRKLTNPCPVASNSTGRLNTIYCGRLLPIFFSCRGGGNSGLGFLCKIDIFLVQKPI